MENKYYPVGAEFDARAPYNQPELPEKEVEVTVSITLSKTVKVKVNDYKMEEDENGKYTTYDFSDCNLHEAVKNQIILPQNLAKITEDLLTKSSNFRVIGIPKHFKRAIRDCKDWYVDDYEVILE